MAGTDTAPTPVVPLKDHCAVIHSGVLYVYSPTAFQSLPLQDGASWSKLPMGEVAIGAVCVDAGDASDPAVAGLYIVGGTSSSGSYTGIQKYSFASKSWETIHPISMVTKERIHHGAAFLPGSSSIVVYGGSQDGVGGLSSQTFLMSLTAPYSVGSYSSSAPPVSDPLVMTWSDNEAVVIGGSSTNNAIYTFDAGNGWSNLGTYLPNSIPSRSLAQSNVIDSTDGGRYIQIFDSSATPNRILRYQILGPGGAVLPPTSVAINQNAVQKTRRQRRDFTTNSFTSYSSTNAPQSVSPGFALASSTDGQMVIVTTDPSDSVSIFDEKKNSWADSQTFFGTDNSIVTATSTSNLEVTSTSPSVTPSPSAVSSPAVTPDSSQSSSDGSDRQALAGPIAGGVIGGLAAIILLIGLFIYIRRRRAKSMAAKQKEAENARLSFTDKEGPSGPNIYQGLNISTATSLGLLNSTFLSGASPLAGKNQAGEVENQSTLHPNVKGHRAKPSDASSLGLVGSGGSPGYRGSYNGDYSPVSFDEKNNHVGLPQITINSPPSTFSRSPGDPIPGTQGYHPGISIGEVSSGTVGAAVVVAGRPNIHQRFPIMEDTQRGSGWSQYFNNNNNNNGATRPNNPAEIYTSMGPDDDHFDRSISKNYTLPFTTNGNTLSMDFTLPLQEDSIQKFGNSNTRPVIKSSPLQLHHTAVVNPYGDLQPPTASNENMTTIFSEGNGSRVHSNTRKPSIKSSSGLPLSPDVDISISANPGPWVAIDDSDRSIGSRYDNSTLNEDVHDTFGTGVGFGDRSLLTPGNMSGYGAGAGSNEMNRMGPQAGHASTMSNATVFPSGASSWISGSRAPSLPKPDMSWFHAPRA